MTRFVQLSISLIILLGSSGFAAEEAVQTVIVRSNPLTEFLILFGSVFILAAGVGMLRFPDFYTRLHASSKLVTLGSLGILVGSAFAFVPETAVQRVLLTALFFLLTSPIGGYMVARAGYLQGLKPYFEKNSIDEWQQCGAEKDKNDQTAKAT